MALTLTITSKAGPPGPQPLIEALLPGMLEPSGWWDKVARPAFAANPLVCILV